MGFHRKLQRVRVHLAQGGTPLPYSVEGVLVARNREYLTLRDAVIHDTNDNGVSQMTTVAGDFDVRRANVVGLQVRP